MPQWAWGVSYPKDNGLLEDLVRRGNEVYDHWKEGLSKEGRVEVGKKQQRADFFLTSTNALTMDGKLINVHATGNRVTSMIFGPSRVIVITGANKIVKNLNAGLARLKKVAAPLNCQRRKDPPLALKIWYAGIATLRAGFAGLRPLSKENLGELENLR